MNREGISEYENIPEAKVFLKRKTFLNRKTVRREPKDTFPFETKQEER